MDFTLVDQAFLALVDKFDRILNGQDVGVIVGVDVIDHRRQRRRLARSGRAGHQNQPTRVAGDFLEEFGAAQILQRQDLGGNGPEHRRRAPVLIEGVDAEAGDAWQFEREVALQEFLVIAALLVVHDVVDQRVYFLGVQRRHVDAADVAIDADHRRQAGAEMQVRGFVLEREGQEFGDIHAAMRGRLVRGGGCQYPERHRPGWNGFEYKSIPFADMASPIADRVQRVLERIHAAERVAGRANGAVGLVAVSKTQPAEAIRQAAAAGQQAFAENYLQEALAKQDELTDLPGLIWHFIGPIQSNKTRPIAERFDWVHTIDRHRIAERLGQQRPADKPPLNICLQVNVSGEASKSGVSLAVLPELAAAVAQLPRLRLRGLMTIPAPANGFEQQRMPFRILREAMTSLALPGLDTLSMGMSDDLEAAIFEGATLVRVGTALFGPRSG